MSSIKERVMAKIAEEKAAQSREQEDIHTDVVPSILTHEALGTWLDTSTNKWSLIKIKYNPITEDVGFIEKIPAEDKGIVTEMFKLAAISGKIV